MTSKTFPTLGVVGAWSGFLMAEGGFGDIHAVFDHLYPGIMTVGIAAMSKHAAAFLLEHVPALATLPAVTSDNWQEIAKLALEQLGPELSVPGPAEVDTATIKRAFDDFGKGAGR